MGFLLQQSMSLSYETGPFIQVLPGLLCEGGRLALLSRQAFGMQCPSVPKDAQGLREQVWTHMKANGSELESRKSWSCQASRQGLCHGPKLPNDKQGGLGIARRPASGRDVELRDSNSISDESHARILARILLLPMTRSWNSKHRQALINQSTVPNPTSGHNNQSILGNGSRHQQPTCHSQMPTMSNK
jgi:hypothetical protein